MGKKCQVLLIIHLRSTDCIRMCPLQPCTHYVITNRSDLMHACVMKCGWREFVSAASYLFSCNSVPRRLRSRSCSVVITNVHFCGKRIGLLADIGKQARDGMFKCKVKRLVEDVLQLCDDDSDFSDDGDSWDDPDEPVMECFRHLHPVFHVRDFTAGTIIIARENCVRPHMDQSP